MEGLPSLSIQGLLKTHSAVADELRNRKVIRTSNNPLGDVTEHLFQTAFGWNLETNSRAGFDATCTELGRIQIKSRRVSSQNRSRQAGDIRRLGDKLFDYLAGVVFDESYEVHVAMLIPHHLILAKALDIQHTNSSRIYLRDDWVKVSGVRDLTASVREAWASLNA
jgi:hypothetical protein